MEIGFCYQSPSLVWYVQMGEAKVKPFCVRALFDFSNDDTATVSLKKGELFTVYRLQDEWMYGVHVSGKAGFFPAVFGEVVNHKQQEQQTVAEVDLGFSYEFIGPDLCRAKLTEQFGLGHIVIKVPAGSGVLVLQEATLAKIAVKRAKPSSPAPFPPAPSSDATVSSSVSLPSSASSPDLSLSLSPKRMSVSAPPKKMSFSSFSPTAATSIQSQKVSGSASASTVFEGKQTDSYPASVSARLQNPSTSQLRSSSKEPPLNKIEPISPTKSPTSSPRVRERSLSTSQVHTQPKEHTSSRSMNITSSKQPSPTHARSLSRDSSLNRSDSSSRLPREASSKLSDQQQLKSSTGSSSRSLLKEPPPALKRADSQQSLRSVPKEISQSKADTIKPNSMAKKSDDSKTSDASTHSQPLVASSEQQPKDLSQNVHKASDPRSRRASASGRPTVLQTSDAPVRDKPAWSGSAARAGATNTKFSAQPATTPMARNVPTSKMFSGTNVASSKTDTSTKATAVGSNSSPLRSSSTTTTNATANTNEANMSKLSSSKPPTSTLAIKASPASPRTSEASHSSTLPGSIRQVQRSASKSMISTPLSSTRPANDLNATTTTKGGETSTTNVPPSSSVSIASISEPANTSSVVSLSSSSTIPVVDTTHQTSVKDDTSWPVTAAQPTSSIRKCTVLHAFHQKDSAYTMLSLEVGDMVTILREEGDWIEGECKGTTGYVPKSFVEEHPSQQSSSSPSQQSPSSPSQQLSSRQPCQTLESPESAASPRLKNVMANLDRALLDLKLDGPSSPRILAAIELVETERRYVEDLQILQSAILLPLQKSAAELNESKGFVDHLKRKLHGGGEGESINSIVSQWLAVCAQNVPFLAAMQVCVQKWHMVTEKEHVLGPILLEHLPKFTQTYGKYCAHYYSIQNELNRVLNKHSRFSRIRKNADESGALQGRTIGSYLISPIQRVPRYQMLIGELLKCTTTDHQDYDRLQEVLKVVMEVGKAINESVRVQENHELTMKLELTFDCSPLFSAQPRELLRYGELMKLSSRKNSSSYVGDVNDLESSPIRTFFLFEDMLAYARVKVGDKLTLRARWAINTHFEVIESSSSPLQIIIKSAKSITLFFTDPDEKTNWLTDMQKCLQKQLQRTRCGYCRSELPLSSLTKCSICFGTICSSCSRLKNDDNCCITCQDFNKVPLPLQRKTSVLALRSSSRKFSTTTAPPPSHIRPPPPTPTTSAATEVVTEPTENSPILDCPQKHGLSLNIALQEGYGCDACSLDMQVGERMQCCIPCNYFVCVACQHRLGVSLKADRTQLEIDAMIEKAQTGFLDRFLQGTREDEEETPRLSVESYSAAVPDVIPENLSKKFSLRDLRQRIPRPLPSPAAQSSLASPDASSVLSPPSPSTTPPRSISPQRLISNTFAKARRASGI